MGRVRVSLLVLCSTAGVLVGCDAIRERLTPTEPTAATPKPAPISIPVILPKPAPTPVPPAPTPGPNPTPAPTAPPPAGGSCSLPPSTNPNGPCTMGSNSFLGEVEQAITRVTEQQPGIFDFNNTKCANCYYVKNPGKFTSAVVANLSAAGLCAFYDGEELGVKNSNSFNDQYDILVASGHIWRGPGSYRSTCRPAWF